MTRCVAIVAACSLSIVSPSCTMGRAARSNTMLVGGITTAVGLGMVATGPRTVDSNHNGANEWSLNDDYSVPLLGTLLVLAGLAIFVASVGSDTSPDRGGVQPSSDGGGN